MKINVKKIAKLANLKLNDKELANFEDQLSSIIKYIENLQKLETEKIEETSQITGLENVTREDTAIPSFTQTEALSNAKSIENGLFKVKAVFEEQ